MNVDPNLHPASGLPPGAPAQPAAHAARRPLPRRPLVIGVDPAAAKERLVLQSMIRVLHGQHGLDLRFVEEASECDVYFVPGSMETRVSGRCIRVRMLPPGSQDTGMGLSIVLPLRVMVLTALLHSASDILNARDRLEGGPSRRASPAPLATGMPVETVPGGEDAGTGDLDMSGVQGLFRHLTTGLMAHERRSVVVARGGGAAPLLIDFKTQKVHCRDPIAALLRDRHRVEEPRRPEADEATALRQEPEIRVGDLLWAAALCLGLSDAPVPPLRGRYRLLRWPDAAALSHPGVTEWASHMSAQPMEVSTAARAASLDEPTVRWLLEASIALGIAVPVDTLDLELPIESPPETRPLADIAPPGSNPDQPLFSRLRNRLRPW